MSNLDTFIYECCIRAPEIEGGVEIIQRLDIKTQYWNYDVDWWPIYAISSRTKPFAEKQHTFAGKPKKVRFKRHSTCTKTKVILRSSS